MLALAKQSLPCLLARSQLCDREVDADRCLKNFSQQ